eukprot:1752610-Prymnesium_polylepis.1
MRRASTKRRLSFVISKIQICNFRGNTARRDEAVRSAGGERGALVISPYERSHTPSWTGTHDTEA